MSVAVSRADKAGKRVMGAAPQVVAGRQRLVERIGDTELSMHPGAFFQVDPDNARQLHELVAEAVGDAHVLDLYAGVGAYGRMLARDRGAGWWQSKRSRLQCAPRARGCVLGDRRPG